MTANPGSEEARAQGCICPVLDNGFGREPDPSMGGWVITEGCPVHKVPEDIPPDPRRCPHTKRREANVAEDECVACGERLPASTTISPPPPDAPWQQPEKMYLVMRLLGPDNFKIEDVFGKEHPVSLPDESLIGYLPVFDDLDAAQEMAGTEAGIAEVQVARPPSGW